MKAANPKLKPKPPPPPGPQPASKASSSSSSAADPNPNRIRPDAAGAGAAAAAAPAASTPPNPNPNGAPNPAPFLASPQPPPHLPPPLPPSRPLLTVAAVEAALASIPPAPDYGLECLDRRTVTLSDGTVRSYFVLPLEPPPHLRQPLPMPMPMPPLPPRHHLGPPGPVPGADMWPPPPMPAPPLLGPALKRKWEGQANGVAPGASSGRQLMPPQQKPKQVKVETPAPVVDVKALKSAFLKMVKSINENTEHKKNYLANGKISQLKCVVCGRDSIDLHALLNHAYNAKNSEFRADHLGLHKALCVLMGWNYSVDPVHKKAYQTLSSADAEANQGDLILWPPTIIVENTYKSKSDGQKDGMSNKEMEDKLREMGFTSAGMKPQFGKDGRRFMLVKFASSQVGLNEAVRLAEFFEAGGHGRTGWSRARSIPPTAAGGDNPMLVKVNQTGEQTWVLYGYLATAWDLDMLDTESKLDAVIKSRKELDLSD